MFVETNICSQLTQSELSCNSNLIFFCIFLKDNINDVIILATDVVNEMLEGTYCHIRP